MHPKGRAVCSATRNQAAPHLKIIRYDYNIDNLCADELFHQNKPIPNTIDAYSYYCCILSINDHRDGDTRGVHLLDAKDQRLNPRVIISDQAHGLVSAQGLVFPGIVHHYDNFHLSRMLMDSRRFYRNRFQSGGGAKPVNGKQRHYIPWAELLKRVFRIDVEKCSRCGAKVKVVAVINEHKIIERILSHQEKTGRFNRAMPTYGDIIAQHRRSPELIF